MRLIDGDALLDELPVHPDGGMRSVKGEGLMIRVRNTVKNAPTVSGWISVKDMMPEEKENPLTHDFTEVICFCDFGGRPKRTDIRAYGFGKRQWESEPHFWHGTQIMDGVVTHWMPLPEPPKEENHETD